MPQSAPATLHRLRDDWHDRLRAARDRAAEQVDGMGVADLRALRTTIDEEMDRLADTLPAPGPVPARAPMTAEEQAEHVRHALQYSALEVRRRIVDHELRRRALGPEAVEETASVPPRTKELAAIAWEVMAKGNAETTADVFRAVAERAGDDMHVTTAEKWLRRENPFHPEETEGRWGELQRAVLLAAS
jgi:hypothetical protein